MEYVRDFVFNLFTCTVQSVKVLELMWICIDEVMVQVKDQTEIQWKKIYLCSCISVQVTGKESNTEPNITCI